MNTKRLRLSFGFAAKGVRYAIADQQNIRIQFLIGLLAILLAVILKLEPVLFVLLLIVISQVLSLEMINSALEKYVDKLTPEEDKTIGIVKDILAGAVLVSAIFAVIIGIIIFYKPFINKFF